MKAFARIVSAVIVTICAGPLMSAPMIPIGPMDIEGTVEVVSWHPKTFIKGQTANIDGKEVPFSGTLGIDRTTKAKYSVRLVNTVVEKPAGADSPYYKSLPSGAPAMVTVYRDKDDGYIKKGMRIKIYGYEIGGDEGGKWESYNKIEILKEP